MSAWVDCDTNCRCEFARNASRLCHFQSAKFHRQLVRLSHLQLFKREAPTRANSAVVSNRWAADDRAELINRTRSQLSRLLYSCFSATVFASGLDCRLSSQHAFVCGSQVTLCGATDLTIEMGITTDLIKVDSHTTLPVLVEVWLGLSASRV